MYFDARVMLPDSINALTSFGDDDTIKEYTMMLCVKKCPTTTVYLPQEDLADGGAYRICEYPV